MIEAVSVSGVASYDFNEALANSSFDLFTVNQQQTSRGEPILFPQRSWTTEGEATQISLATHRGVRIYQIMLCDIFTSKGLSNDRPNDHCRAPILDQFIALIISYYWTNSPRSESESGKGRGDPIRGDRRLIDDRVPEIRPAFDE